MPQLREPLAGPTRTSKRQRLIRKHGNVLKYKKEGCRCNRCRLANTLHMRSYRQRQRQYREVA